MKDEEEVIQVKVFGQLLWFERQDGTELDQSWRKKIISSSDAKDLL